MLTVYIIASSSDGYQVGIDWGIHRPTDPIHIHLAQEDRENFQYNVSKFFLQT